MKIHPQADLTRLAAAVLKTAVVDAETLRDPLAGAWLLSDQARLMAKAIDLDPKHLAETAAKSLEKLVKK